VFDLKTHSIDGKGVLNRYLICLQKGTLTPFLDQKGTLTPFLHDLASGPSPAMRAFR